jgi:serine/threonine protein phosphatase PrpC
MEEQSILASRDSASMTSIETRTESIMRSAFGRLDRDFCNLCTKDGRDWDSGSTALICLIVDDVVTLANLGDCRGVACRMMISDNDFDEDIQWEAIEPDDEVEKWDRACGGDAENPQGRLFFKEITDIHSPLLLDERTRIEQANGWIVNETEIPTGQLHRMDFFDKDVVEIVKRCFADRLKQHRSDPVRQIKIARTCGDLAVSRAIGDRDFKAAYNMPRASTAATELSMSWEGPPVFIYPEGHSGRFKGDLVSHDPDIKFFRVGQKGVVDEFLLMACDGLWDVMDCDDAVRIAKDLLFDKKLSAKDGVSYSVEDNVILFLCTDGIKQLSTPFHRPPVWQNWQSISVHRIILL